MIIAIIVMVVVAMLFFSIMPPAVAQPFQ